MDGCHQLYLSLRSIVEAWLASQTSSWIAYTGLSRLTSVVHSILQHGLKERQGSAKGDYWPFLQGLCVLSPNLAPALAHHQRRVICGSFPSAPAGGVALADPGLLWVQCSLNSYSLSSQIALLLSDVPHLQTCYYDWAYMRQPVYAEALVLCLQGVENNEPSVLASLNPGLVTGSVDRVPSDGKLETLLSTEELHFISDSLSESSSPDIIREYNGRLRSGKDTQTEEDTSVCHQSHSESSAPISVMSDELPILTEPLTFGNVILTFDGPVKRGQESKHGESHERLLHINVHKPECEERQADFPICHCCHCAKNCCSHVQHNIMVRCHSAPTFTVAESPPCFNKSHRLDAANNCVDAKEAQENLDIKMPGKSANVESIEIPGNGLNPIDSIAISNMKVNVPSQIPNLSLIAETNLNEDKQDATGITNEDSVGDLNGSSSLVVTTIHNPRRHTRSRSDITSEIRCRPPLMDGGGASTAFNRSALYGYNTIYSMPLMDSYQLTLSKSYSLPSELAAQTPGDRVDSASSYQDDDLQDDCSISSSIPQSGIFKRPQEGQSLTSFLSSQDFHTCADLDKENAHFSISEALIAAMEQMKVNRAIQRMVTDAEDDSDEEIQHLKQRIRIRRRERQQEKSRLWNSSILADSCINTATTSTTSHSPTPATSPSTSFGSQSLVSGSSESDHLDLSDCAEEDTRLIAVKESGLSLSLASLYSDADIFRPPLGNGEDVSRRELSSPLSPTSVANSVSASDTSPASKTVLTESLLSGSSVLSAESVALNLLKRFSEKQLPKASDLEWLVSEQDAPQMLLPLPSSWPVSPDDAECEVLSERGMNSTLRLRGNLEWAPPRPQIIFIVHPKQQRLVALARQNYRCAGCGAKVEQGFMKRFRYCEYLGKYFCQRCHNNRLAVIPAHILRKWDFTKFHVSDFSADLLDKISPDPLFNVMDINPHLYRRVYILTQIRDVRMQLFYLRDFIQTCRMAEKLTTELLNLPQHMLLTPHTYSINEFLQAKSGELLTRLKAITNRALQHVAQCELCGVRGFICEFCKNDKDIIFPYQLQKVAQCKDCWSCYHRLCFVPEKCPKCARIESRKLRLLEDDSASE